MKRLFATAVCAALLVSAAKAQQPAAPTAPATAEQAAPAAPVNPITVEQTRELFRLAGMQRLIGLMAHQALAAQRMNAPPYIPADVWEDLEKGFSQIDFAALLTPYYQKYLSREDAEKTIEFYKTSSGQHFLAAQPGVMEGAGKAGQAQIVQIGQEVFARHEQEILAAKLKYDTERRQERDDLAPTTPPAGTASPPSQK
jgi:hypothetical protein